MEIKSYKKKNGDTAYKFRVYVGKENGKRQARFLQSLER